MTQTIPESPSADAAPADLPVPCPKCKQPLVDPKGLGWCKACGFCRSLQDGPEKTFADLKPVKPKPTEPPKPAGTGRVPRWPFVMALGMILVAGATIAASRYLQLTPYERALFASVQIGAGVLVMFFGQLFGVIRIAADESSLGFWDAVIPLRLYGLVLKHMPKACLTVLVGSWGLTAIVAAAVFIGGLQHWFTYLPGNHKNGPNVQYPTRR